MKLVHRWCAVILAAWVGILLSSGWVHAQTQITLWHMEEPPYRVAHFQKVIDRFNEENPDLRVRQQVVSWTDVYQRAIAAIQSRNQPEMLFTIPDFTTVIKQTGALRPATDIVRMLDERHKFIPAAVDPYHYDGEIWAVPLYGMINVMWYRKDHFEKAGLDPDNPPRTWDELLEALEALRQAGIRYPTALPVSRHLATDQQIYPFMIGAGAEHIFDEDGRVAFDNPATVRAFEYFQKLFEYSLPDAVGWAWAEPQLAFNEGTISVAFEKGQYLGPFEEQSGTPPSNLGSAPIPWPEDGVRGSIYYSNGVMILTNDPKKLEGVRRFLEYLFQPEVKGDWLAGMEPGLFLPVTEDTSVAESFWSHPIISTYRDHVQMMIDESKYGRLFGFTRGEVDPDIGRISAQNILSQAVQKMIVDGWSAADAVRWGADMMRAAVGQ